MVLVGLGVGVGGGSARAAPQPAHLQVVTKSLAPFVIPKGDQYTGFSIDLLDQLAKRVPFTYDIHAVDTVGQQLQEIQQGKSDLAIAGISITSEREQVVDFSYPIYNSGLQVMTTNVGAASNRSIAQTLGQVRVFRLVRPIGVVFLLVLAVAHLAWLIESRRTPDFPQSYLQGIGEGLWWAAVTLTTVGYGDRTPRSAWGRTLGIFWMIAAIFLIANLTASITTALTVQELRSAINGPNDLPGRRVATVRGTAASTELESRGLAPVEVATIGDAYRLLQGHKADAVVFDSPILLYFADTGGKGAVRVVGPLFAPQDYGIALPLGSPYRKPINEAILGMIEDGTYARLQKSWFGT